MAGSSGLLAAAGYLAAGGAAVGIGTKEGVEALREPTAELLEDIGLKDDLTRAFEDEPGEGEYPHRRPAK